MLFRSRRRACGSCGRVEGALPALRNLTQLHLSAAFAGHNVSMLLQDFSEPTTLELAEGNWREAVRALGGPQLDASLAQLEAGFDQHVAPSRVRPATRAGHWDHWRLVVTWAVARKAVGLILPMAQGTLKALMWDLQIGRAHV